MRVRTAGLILTLTLGLIAVPMLTEAQELIRIGASLALTGAYAAPAQNQHRGYQLCVKEANEQGGLLGRKIELIVSDDRSDPATAARLYENPDGSARH